MTTVGVAELKARLSAYLRKVRAGATLTVLDRNTPVAEIVPASDGAALEVRRATRKPSEVPLPPASPKPTDSLALLLEDRAAR